METIQPTDNAIMSAFLASLSSNPSAAVEMDDGKIHLFADADEASAWAHENYPDIPGRTWNWVIYVRRDIVMAKYVGTGAAQYFERAYPDAKYIITTECS